MRMMAKCRWKAEGWRFCCHGHDPNLYRKGGQRSKEKREWKRDQQN